MVVGYLFFIFLLTGLLNVLLILLHALFALAFVNSLHESVTPFELAFLYNRLEMIVTGSGRDG